ncbi:MAG TPA: C25 family cysteine peptidase [Phycisphaerae bacterium]|nr:C25 family cysteine peptidase [Phycisphaerae bacterium]
MIRLSASTCRGGLAAGVFLLIVLPVVAAATPGAVPKDAVDVTVLENTPDRIVVHYRVQDFTQHSVNIDGEEYTRIALGKESPFKVVGDPELPNICRSLIIWDDAQVAVSVLDSAYYELADIDVMPSKGCISRQVDPDSVPYTFGEAYETDAFYPGPLAELGEPYILRDFRGVVLQANPFQYNPVTRTLRVYTEMTVEVIPVGPAKVNALEAPAIERELSLAFHKIYKHHFINYEFHGRYAPLDEEGDMLIICYDAWLPNIQPLVDHKNSIGIDTTAVGVSTIGNNSSSIKSHIQSRYNGSDLAFVLLVGDSAQVATYYSGGAASDPSYSLLSGGDDYPDILVGRFSAQNASQVDTQVLRTIEYEQMPATEQDWFKRGTGIGSAEGAGYGDDGESDKQHMDNIRADLLAYGYTEVDRIYDPGASAYQVTNALNAGRGITNYCGHGWMQGWLTTGFSNSHVDALVNDNMLPFITSVACNTGEFNSGTCFAEAWLRATHGSEPTGAIGMYASSISMSWAPPMSAQDETVDLLVAEAYFSFGALCFAGSCQMMDEYGYDGVSEFKAWHVFGDPSLRVYGEAVVPGDLDDDGDVDQHDLGILLADYGCTGGDCPGDCDGDGDTDQADLGILLANWGYGT